MTPALAVRRAVLAYAVFAAVVAVVVAVVLVLVGLGVIWSVLIALVVGGAGAWVLAMRADKAALAALGARPLSDGELPRLENLVEGLVVANGFRMPALHLVDDAAPNAAAVGRTPKHAGLVVTTGLLERLKRIELEGVVAHELSRIRARETLTGVTAGQLVGRFLGFSDGVSSQVAERLLEPTVTVSADLAGVAITRYPPGLAAALQSMRADGRSPKINPRAYRHLWINIPENALIRQDFTLLDRIDVLEEL